MAENNKVLQIIIRARDLASGQFKKLAGGVQRLRGRFKRLSATATSLKGILVGLLAVVGAGALAKGALDTAAAFERYETSLKTVLGTASEAKGAMGWITEFTAKTPFELDQVTEGFVQLSARGFDAQKHMKTLGDTAAAMGKPLSQAVEAFTDAATGEFERLKEFGIKARTEGDKVIFAWQQNGQQMEKEVEKTQDAITEGLSEIWTGQFEGGMEEFSETWTGMWSNAQDQFTLFQKSVMDAGLFSYLKAGLTIALEKIEELKESGQLDVWARKISAGAIKAFKILLFAVGQIGDAWRGWKMIWNGLKATFASFYSYILKLLMGLLEAARKVADFLGADEWAGKMEGAVNKLWAAHEKLNKVQKESLKNLQEIAAQESYSDKMAALAGEIDRAAAEIRAKEEAITEASTEEERKRLGQQKDAEKQRLEALKEEKKLLEARYKAEAAIAAALLKTEMAQLENAYERGQASVEDYFGRRREIMEQQYEAERAAVTRQIEKEEDAAKAVELRAELVKLEEEHKRAVLELTREQSEAEEEVNQKRRETQRMLQDLKFRAGTEAGALTTQHQRELAEMDRRHNEEIARLEELNATKAEINEAYRLQELEREELLADQKRAVRRKELQNMNTVAGQLSKLFDQAYEASGEHAKEFFYMQKAAAIAQAIINAHLAATEALALLGPIAGPVAAGAIYAQGMISVAQIMAQQPGFDVGGLVPGSSPHKRADNILARLTAGEYVQPVDVVDYYGVEVMEALRQRKVPRALLAGYSVNVPSPPPTPAYASGGAVSGGPGRAEINIINVTDPRELDRYLATPAGQDAIINILSSRREAVRRILR